MFGKRISEVTREDILKLCAEAVQESGDVELKETLPAKNGRDPWFDRQDRIGDRARNELLEEVIGFANAYGGTLVVGIAETKEKPARAAAVAALPRCIDLADRLRLQCRDCIEPQIPLLDVRGVPTKDDGSGVVIFQVPRSRMAPHRHVITRECYVRRADRTEKMTMREMQDLTLQIQRGLEAIERTFDVRSEKSARDFTQFRGNSDHAFGIRVTVVPLAPLYVERVHNNTAVQPPLSTLWSTIGGEGPVELSFYISGGSWRPILRGSRMSDERNNSAFTREVHCDGLIEYSTFVGKHGDSAFVLYPSWLMCLVGNALCAAERFRQAASAPNVEYGLELEIQNTGGELPIAMYGGRDPFGRRLGSLPAGDIVFPRYSVGAPEEFVRLSILLERDFWHAAGNDFKELLVIDFDRALREQAGGRAT